MLIANTLNIAADIAAMGEALRLVVGGPVLVYIAVFGIGCLAAEILIPYHSYSRYLKALTLVLFAYVAAAFTIRIPWGEVLAATFLPRLSWDRDYMLMLVAIFGTTISPYMFFWQASLEAEERKLRSQDEQRRGRLHRQALAQRESFRIGLDTTTGMVLSNVIGFFIIVTTAATLHAHGKTQIDTAAQAAEALRPLAGPLAFFLFSLGIIGTGLLAVPVLAGSAAYAVAESFGWEGSLEMPARSAPGFYLIVAAATIAGLLVRAHAARSDPDAVLERGGQRHRRRAADGRHDGGRRQPQNHGQIRRLARADDLRLVRDGTDGRRRRGDAAHQRCRLTSL